MVYEFQIRMTTTNESDVIKALNAEQDNGFELVTATGQSGGVVMLLFRRPKIINPVRHGPKIASTVNVAG